MCLGFNDGVVHITHFFVHIVGYVVSWTFDVQIEESLEMVIARFDGKLETRKG
jgi:hypothetical protein